MMSFGSMGRARLFYCSFLKEPSVGSLLDKRRVRRGRSQGRCEFLQPRACGSARAPAGSSAGRLVSSFGSALGEGWIRQRFRRRRALGSQSCEHLVCEWADRDPIALSACEAVEPAVTREAKSGLLWQRSLGLVILEDLRSPPFRLDRIGLVRFPSSDMRSAMKAEVGNYQTASFLPLVTDFCVIILANGPAPRKDRVLSALRRFTQPPRKGGAAGTSRMSRRLSPSGNLMHLAHVPRAPRLAGASGTSRRPAAPPAPRTPVSPIPTASTWIYRAIAPIVKVLLAAS